ncbi:MAG: S-layer homology domain-containing protein [Candidatus Heteroscillospira sp.]|jgi:hypothetical protein
MRFEKPKRALALVLAACSLGSGISLPASAADLTPSQPGLWLTEIYQNDVKRESVFSNSSDHMEFVEVTNTSEQDIDFNGGGYGLWYEYSSGDGYTMKQLTVENTDESGTTVIPAGVSAVFWNQRTDLAGEAGTDYATVEQFREAMNVSEDVPVFTVSGQAGFTENDRGFAIKDADGDILSYYHYNTTTDDVTADGLSVHLCIPETGSTMSVWQSKKLTSAGKAYSAQLGDQANAVTPAEQPDGLYITEIRPNDSDRSAVYGSGSNDLMECLELTNTTDQEIDLNQEYELNYRIKENSAKVLPLYQYVENEDELQRVGDTEGCTVPANSTVVLWCYRAGHGLDKGSGYETFPTLAEFREAYSIPEEVPVYLFVDQNGLGNTLRGFDLYKKNDDGTKTLVSRYFWDGASDLKDNKSVDLKVSPEGPLMEVYKAQSTTSMGVVSDAQITFPEDDGAAPVLTLSTDPYDEDALKVLDEGLPYGENLHIPYTYAGTATLPVTYAELFWRTNEMDYYEVSKTSSFAIYNKWYAFIDNGYLQGADYVDYYVKFHNDYRTTKTDVQRVDIISPDGEGIRLSLNNADVKDTAYSGTVQVSAKDFAGGSIASIQLDGEAVELNDSMERGAYFVFDHTGVDSYFQNALTTGGDTEETGTVIGSFSKCSTLPSNGRLAIQVGGQYFTYNDDGSASIELTVRPGTYGTCWEAYTDENNEDFVASNMKLVLMDGTELTPDTCVGQNITTLEEKTLDAAGPIKIGDSANQYIYVKMTFTIPADKVDATAKAFQLDTTKLEDGVHTLTALNENGTENSVTFTVGNTEPAKEEKQPMDLTVDLTLDGGKATVSGAQADAVSIRSAEKIQNFAVLEGAGDGTGGAAEKTDSGSTVSDNGQYPYQLLEIPVTGEEENLRVQLTASDNYGKDVQLYARQGDAWKLLEVDRDEDDQLTALIPVADCAADGKIQVLIQARTTAYTPYTGADVFNSVQGQDSGWDGESTANNPYAAPDQYDFSIAWYTDTQYYSEQYNKHYTDMTDWIIEHQKELDIKYVFHTGDIADEYNEEYQFAFARSQQEKLEQAGIPTGVLGGNHDVAHGNKVYDLYWKYFGEEYYEDNSYYGGSYKNNLGHYDVIEVDGEEILFISMSWDIYTPETDWINSVLDAHPGVRAIITTHCGINANGAQSYTSNILLNNVCRNHPQVMAILNGHYHGASVNFIELESDAGEKHTVYQICTDYQSAPEGGSGYIKMLYFDLANDKIYLNSYSPSVPGTGEDDVNYYDDKSLVFDESMLADDGTGVNRYQDNDIDIVTLPVDFDRETEKTLTVSNIQVDGLYAEELAAGTVDQAISVPGYAGKRVYAALKDGETVVAYSEVQSFAKESGGGSDSGSGSSSASTDKSKAQAVEELIKAIGTVDENSSAKIDAARKAYDKLTAAQKKLVTNYSVLTGAESAYAQLTSGMPFTDVNNHWAKSFIEYAYKNKFMSGISDTLFAPDQKLSRAMIAQLLYNLEGSPASDSNAFTDVEAGQWYAKAVNWASANGLVAGYGNGTFGPNDNITREQLALMLYRYAAFKDCDTGKTADLEAFTDAAQVSSWALDAMRWASAESLINGKNGAVLDPAGHTTRAEAATILTRFCENIAK